MGISLLLGPVLFQDFELPQHIAWGGAQRLTIHRLPGGARVIDAMGRDDGAIAWSGIFTGSDAVARARALDLLRADGSVWPLTWDSFFYSVVVGRFEADYAHANWIPYRISCTVVRDEAEGLVETALSLAGNVVSDLAAADNAGTGIDFSQSVAAMSAPGAATRAGANYTVARSAVDTAAAQVDTQIAVTEPALVAPSGVASLVQAGDAAGQLATLTQARGYLLRAQTNLLNAGS